MRPPAALRSALTAGRQLIGVARALAVAAGSSAHPQQEGAIAVDGLDAPLEVLRDRHGVPHVFASTEADALFGQGFVHAQDRLFQMEATRRMAAGRLAEVAGPDALESDRFMRRLGLADLAGRDLARAEADERDLLLAYARGVNAGIRSLRVLPPEFALLGLEPEPWHPEHSLLVGRTLAFSFAANWDTELHRERLLRALGPERAAELDRAYLRVDETASEAPYTPAVERLLTSYRAALSAGLSERPASNAWAVAGARTASGSPLLASDPHLQTQLPGMMHVTHLSGGALDVIGADVPGVPGIAMGHNRELAWGLTAGMADVSDCYIETVDPDDPTRYLTPEGWVTGRTRIERIAVRGGDSVEERVLETRHGPVVGPALPGETRAIALRSTALEAGETVASFLGLARAESVHEFEQAIDEWSGATFNFVWASRGGETGYRLGGDVPGRAPGEGLLPQDGAASPGPPDVLPARALPRLVNPPGGAVVSANHAPGGDRELGEEWFEPWRARRIRSLLDAQDGHTVASMEAIQFDQHSEPLLRLRDLIVDLGAMPDGETLDVVARWDGAVTADSAGAAVLETVYVEIATALVSRLAGPETDIVLGSGTNRMAPASSFHYRLQGPLIDVLASPRPPWCRDEADRDRLLRAAVARALAMLRDRQGPRPRAWTWGAAHRLRLDHMVSTAPVVGRRFSRGPYPSGGDVNTVNPGGFTPFHGADGLGFTAAYRQVIDLSDFDRSTFQLPAGNSGIPGHPRYDDCTGEFLAGRYRPLLYSRAAVEREIEYALVLEPARATAAAPPVLERDRAPGGDS